MKQATLFEKGILQSPKSKICEVTTKQKQQSKPSEVIIKKILDFVKYWSEIHEDTNWNEVSYDLKHGKKSNKQLFFKMVGNGESKEDCGHFVTEGCDNFLNHPNEMVYVQI